MEYEQSVLYNCHGPFHEQPDLWWPVYIEGVCYLDNDTFEGKTILEVEATPLVEPLFPLIDYANIGSLITPNLQYTPKHIPCMFCGEEGGWTSTVVVVPIPDVPPIPLPASGVLMLSALFAIIAIRRIKRCMS